MLAIRTVACAVFTTALAVALGSSPAVVAAAPAGPVGYLGGEPLGYELPLAPRNDSARGRQDMAAVHAAHHVGDRRMREAFEDAAAYDYDQLLPRFDEAAGTSLELRTRPILSHMLRTLLVDTNTYVTEAKYSDQAGIGTRSNRRPRPYRRDRSIIPCETDFLYPSDNSSYPSGHATNGYIAALLIADVISPGPRASSDEPDRRPLIMARGLRYGQNRVVCGVHYPTDVRAGQVLARHIYDRASTAAEFRKDLECARREDQRSPPGRVSDDIPPLDAECRDRVKRYTSEAISQIAKRRANSEAVGS